MATIMSDTSTTDRDDQHVQDPVLQYCPSCGAANDNHHQPEGNRHHCRVCGGFVRAATPHESWLLGKRLKQGLLHEQGQVTVGGYTPGVDGPEYDSPETTPSSQRGEAGA